ncbi:MAG: AmmeMemoRadiSam system protein B [Candidatus Aminicenantes bacterium]|nr:AmmeMemoRadiSam system protein B [Candidatus Aminicenantes bacterium]
MVSKVALAAILQLLLNSIISAGVIQRECHYSSFSDQPDLFLRAIHRFNGKSIPRTGGHISGGIVTHHFLASELMVEYFETLAGNAKPQRVVIIGPDHSGRVPKGLAISGLKWKTPFGYLQPDRKAIRVIGKYLGLKDNNPEYFFKEHSIGILVPFVKYYFPHAKIVPVIVGEGISRDSLEQLVHALGEISDDNTHVILSMDFSHGKTAEEGKLTDAIAADVILNGAYDKIWGLDVDCRPGLYLMLRLHAKDRVIIGTHSNSAEVSRKNLKNCTTYFTVYFISAARRLAGEVKIPSQCSVGRKILIGARLLDFVSGTCAILHHAADQIDVGGSNALHDEAGICSAHSVTNDA